MAKTRTSWKKGQSGNLDGAPKRTWTWAGELQKAVEKSAADGRPIKEIIANSLLGEALKGNVQAHKAIMDRMDGMPIQKNELTSGGKPIVPIMGGSSVSNDDGIPKAPQS